MRLTYLLPLLFPSVKGQCVECDKEENDDVFVDDFLPDVPTAKPSMLRTRDPTKSPTASPTLNPTSSPTVSPTEKPTKGPTKGPTKAPTEAPTKGPTKAPTKGPTKAPTKAPTKSPTKGPTKKPTPAPTDKPTPSPTAGADPNAENDCVWPQQTTQFSAITSGDLKSSAKLVYSKIAIGGKLSNPSGHTVTVNGKAYYNEISGSNLLNFNAGSTQIDDLSDVPIDFSTYEWLARNMKSSNKNGKKVVVFNSGNGGSGANGCYTLSDLRPEESAQDYDNGNTLAVFNTHDDICLSSNAYGRKFGPSVLAPFSKVTLTSDFIDGIVIAKEFVCNNGGAQLHGNVFNGPIECVTDQDETTDEPTSSPTAGTGADSEEETVCDPAILNLGYGYSEAMHDPALGNSHYGQNGQCFPKVHNINSPPSGKDDAVAVFVGGNFKSINGAEVEGKMVVIGNFVVGSAGSLNFISAGEGSQITPHKGGNCITVGGAMSSAKRLEIFYPHYQCTVVTKGKNKNAARIAPTWMTDMGFVYKRDVNLDMTEYIQHKELLSEKSKFWGNLDGTPGAQALITSNKFKIDCSNDDVVQVFNIPASSLAGSGYSSYLFNKHCSDKTILLNVQGTGSVTFTTKHMMWTNANGQVQNGGWANFPSCMNSAILWNFPDATNVLINGSDEVQGSLLVNGNLNFKTSGQSGRTMVLGNLEQNYGGSEFHSFEFKPPKPLPEIDCASAGGFTGQAASDDPPPQPNPTASPVKPPTPAPIAQPAPSNGCCSQSHKTCDATHKSTKAACESQNGLIWLANGALSGTCKVNWAACTGGAGQSGVCCPGLRCDGNQWYAQCKV